MKEIALGFLTALFLVIIAMPSLIKVAKLKHLVDEPGDKRKLHRRSVPTIGGILIFAGTILGFSLWFPSSSAYELGMVYDPLRALHEFKFLVASMFILFFLGLKDDIIGVSPSKKLMVHMVVGAILVFMADIRIRDFCGLFGINDMPDYISYLFSVFVYIVIVNAINLIDGVDGLAGGIGLIASFTFAYWFYQTMDLPLALLAAGLGGALLGFLVFNFNPARIFMGDSGSLTIGVVIYVLATQMIDFPVDRLPAEIRGVSKPVLAMAILAYPLIDTIRVFFIRTIQGRSPFSADKNHIHHRLLSLGLNHRQTVLCLYGYTAFIIVLAFLMPANRPNISFLIVGGVALALAQGIFFIPTKEEKKMKAKIGEQAA
ncbi:MAG: undecaprenyl/decaprenyl-phosphate alpha-N-acetylglucosaminyl 1-phosphate transferase [Flavobacteriales bacterium]|nr:undecaprenyl/decaprenyl-phosphate alpha-N-acetylglucosaminyl 1-phosphate transferase [Flavobacteriales bacterium]